MNIQEWVNNPNKVKQFFGDLVTIDKDGGLLYVFHFKDCWGPAVMMRSQYIFTGDDDVPRMSLRFKTHTSFEFRLIANLGI